MALAPEATVEQPQGKLQSAAEKVKGKWFSRGEQGGSDDKAAEGSEVQFRRNLFVDTLNPRVSSLENRRKQKEVAKPSEFVGFSEKTKAEFTTFANDYLTSIARGGREEAGMDALRVMPHAEVLFKLIGADKEDFNEADIPDKVQEILSHPEGWMQMKEVITHEATLAKAIGGFVSMREGKARSNDPTLALADTQNVHPDGNTGLRRIGMKYAKTIWGAGFGAAGYAASEVITDPATGLQNLPEGIADIYNFTSEYLANNPGDSIAKAILVGGGMYVGGRIVGKGFQESRTPSGEQLKTMGTVLEAIKSDPKLSKYIDMRFGMDLNDFAVQPDGSVAEVATNSVGDMRDVINHTKKAIELRDMYYEDLGIPKDVRDILPEQFLVDGTSPERHSEVVHRDIMKRYRLLGGTDDSIPENFELMRKAREIVMANLTEKLAEKMITEKPEHSDLSVINQKIEDRSGDGRVLEKRREALKKENKALEDRTAVLQSNLEDIRSYDTMRLEAEEAQKALPKYLEETFGRPGLSLNEALQEIRAVRRGTDSREFVINGETVTIEPIQLRIDKAREEFNSEATDLLAHNPKLEDEPYEIYKDRIKNLQQPLIDKRNADIAEIREDEKLLNEIEKRLRDLDTQAKEKQDALDPTGDEALDRHRAIFLNTEKQRNDARDIRDLLNSGGLDLQTATPSQILDAINAIHAADVAAAATTPGTPIRGWDKADNTSDINFHILNHVIVMDKAIKNGSGTTIQNFLTNPDLNSVINIPGIGHEHIEMLSDEEIINRAGAAGVMLNETQVQSMRNLIGEYARVITSATRQVSEATEQRVDRVNREADAVKIDDEKKQLEVTRDLMLNQWKVFGQRRKFMSEISDRIPTDPGGVRALRLNELAPEELEGYTESEKAVGDTTAVGYFEVVNMMFDYKDRSDKDEYFKKISEQLPPDKLLDLLTLSAEKYQLPDELVNSTSLNEFLWHFQDKIRNGQISLPAFRHLFTGVIDLVVDKSKALP